MRLGYMCIYVVSVYKNAASSSQTTLYIWILFWHCFLVSVLHPHPKRTHEHLALFKAGMVSVDCQISGPYRTFATNKHASSAPLIWWVKRTDPLIPLSLDLICLFTFILDSLVPHAHNWNFRPIPVLRARLRCWLSGQFSFQYCLPWSLSFV